MAKWLLPYYFCCFGFTAIGQQPILTFDKDSVKVGEPFEALLYFEYPEDSVVLFPDSTYNYYPFELRSIQHYGSLKSNATIQDSVTYELVTFEIFKEQLLDLPVHFIAHGDSASKISNKDTMFVYSSLSDKDTVLIDQTEWMPIVKEKKSYTHLWVIAGISLIVLFLVGLLWLPVRKRLQVQSLKKQLLAFEHQVEMTRNQPHDLQLVQELLIHFKKLLSKTEGKQLTAYTTKELFQVFQHEQLTEALKDIDLSIYGNRNEGLEKALQQLKDFIEEKVDQKIRKVKNEHR